MVKAARFLLLIPLVAFASGCISTSYDVVPGPVAFADSVAEYDVVPPSWITADGKPGGVYPSEEDRATAFAFPSLPWDRGASLALRDVEAPNLFRSDVRFKDGVFVQPPSSEFDQAIEIHSASAAATSGLVINIDAASMAAIRRLDLRGFQRLQAAWLGWLRAQTSCWAADCFSSAFAHNLVVFWRKYVLSEARFARFADIYLNLRKPEIVQYKDSTAMFATRIYPRQQLAITWGNQNFYPELATKGAGASATVASSYSRTTSGGSTRLQIVSDRGMRLYPPRNCRIEGESGFDSVLKDVATPYPDGFKNMFGKWFVPVYNLFDLHNPQLLTAVKNATGDQLRCPDGARAAPRYLFLLAPSVYVKPDTLDKISQFETEGRLGSGEDPQSSYNLLTRQFVILACNTSDIAAVRDEWRRMLDTAAGTPRDHGACGNFFHGVFSGKSFVELRNHFSIDGRLVEDGALSLTTIGQASGAVLGARMNVEGVPGAKPLLDLWRVPPGNQDSRATQRLHIRFYTTMSDVLDEITIVEGDDIHAISIPEILR